MMTAPTRTARRIFPPIAADYERWAAILSFGQDSRWRRAMVAGLDISPGSRVVDIAGGTGSITRLLTARGYDVLTLDLNSEMLRRARERGASVIQASAEALPLRDGSFDAATFGYLLRYVQDPSGCLGEIARVLRPGGRIGMVEFGRPAGVWRPAWWLYTRIGLRAAGAAIRHGWDTVGGFLGQSIDDFADRFPEAALPAAWEAAGFRDVQVQRPSLGGGLVMWGRKR